jgi:hypothetical protein
MADDEHAVSRTTSLSRSPAELPLIRPIRNLRDPDERPAAPDADRRAQGQRLMAARQKYFKTASMAARSLGIAGPTYLAHENGTRQIRDDIAVFYATQFNVSPDWLLFKRGTGPEPGSADAAALSVPAETAAAGPQPVAEASQHAAWRGAGLARLLHELKASVGPHDTFLPSEPGTSVPGRLPPLSQTEGWIAELAPPRANYANECPVAVADDHTLVLRGVLLIPDMVAERARLFAVKLHAGADLLAGQHVLVDPDATRLADDYLFLVMHPGGAPIAACLRRSAHAGRLLVGRAPGKPPIEISEADLQILGRIHTHLTPLTDAEVRKISESMFELTWSGVDKVAVRK